MPTPGDRTAGLAILPAWLSSDRDDATFETVFGRWQQASGWRVAGLALPLEPEPNWVVLASEEGVKPLKQPPTGWREVLQSLGTDETGICKSSGRLFARLDFPGQSQGLLWVEQTGTDSWTEYDRAYVKLSARLMERSALLAAKRPPSVDAERLQQRLADVSIIAGRMAHDFDNVLTGVIGFADLALPLLTPQSLPANYVAEIAKVGQRGTLFTRQLHQFSRSGQTRPQPGHVAAALAQEDHRLRGAMPAGLKVRVDVPAGLAPVAIDAAALAMVFGHVLENAVEACSGQSVIHVKARAVELDAGDAKAYRGRVGPGAHIEVTVYDTGKGIVPDVRAKLFAEPFTTTKVQHRGLGLAIVYRILFAHRGGVRIDAATPPENGTVVRVVLPLATARSAAIASPAGGSL